MNTERGQSPKEGELSANHDTWKVIPRSKVDTESKREKLISNVMWSKLRYSYV